MKNKEAKSIFSSLENFSSIPPPELWDKIEKELDRPQKKRKRFFWWYAAAVFSIGLMLPLWMYFNSGSVDNPEINTNRNGVVLEDKSKSKENPSNQKGVIPAETSVNSLEKNIREKAIPTEVETQSFANGNEVSKVGKESKLSEGFTKSKQHTSDRVAIVSGDQKGVVGMNSDNVSISLVSNHSTTTSTTPDKNSADEIGRRGKIAVLPTDKNKSISDEALSKVDSNKTKSQQDGGTDEVLIDKNNTNKKTKAIAQNTVNEDSSAVVKREVAQLENKLKGLDENKTEKKSNSAPIDKWSVQVFAGVMTSENYNNEKLAGNAVASSQSTGYGIKTNYKLNKKWSVSSGFKINELGQKMEGVAYYDQLSMVNSGYFALQSTPSQSNGMPITMNTNNSLVLLSKSNNDASAVNNVYETGDVAQNLRYFEMPLEVSYSLLNKKKTSISMNTGGFVGKLISNEVSLNGNSIGKSLNVNEYVYGTLLTSTLQYEFYKKTYFFVEPGMNYYINPLENQSFNQFQWLFNFGINVNF